MLQPREADLPALVLVLIVLPLVTYFLLGIWTDTAKRKARISALAQLAAEEACRVQTMASADVIPITPSLRAGFHECARCFAPATTRCSRCKSVRYCSGKCQIIHWRQTHKQECHEWQANSFNVSSWPTSIEAAPARPSPDSPRSPSNINFMDNPIDRDLPKELQDDPLLMSTDTCHDSEAGGKAPVKRVINKLRRVKSRPNDDAAWALDENGTAGFGIRPLYEISQNDDPLFHKLESGNFMSPDEIHRNQDTNSQPYANNAAHQSLKLKVEGNGITQNLSASTPCDIDKHVIAECESDVYITSAELHGAGFSIANETVDVSNSTKGTFPYKKPPYTLGHDAALPQKLTENVSREYPFHKVEKHAQKENGSTGEAENNGSTDFCWQYSKANSNIEGKMAGSKKISKILKRNLVTLNNNNKKNKMYKMLFPYKDLVELFQWETSGISLRGLINCGNSCYANAVLQCLTCTKPLMVYLLRKLHSRTCFVKDWCLMCELEQHVSMLREGRGPLSPSMILSNMRNIGCRIGGGNQEDAHEFLRLLVMSMQSTCLQGLGGEKEVNLRLQETTLIQQLFGGRLRSKVKCLKCQTESERYESIMDLTLEIHGWVESLEDALTQFTAPEDLDGENMYRCGRCMTYVKARKQLNLHEVPNILTIVLKRFQTGKYGKINKCVTFPDMLDMIPFVTGTADNPPLYLLYAVVVHLDTLNASFSGHYVSYVKDLQGSWFRIDDSEVQAVSLSQVMSEGAYMLFYSRSFPRPPSDYVCQEPLQVPTSAKLGASKSHKILKHGQTKQPGVLYDPGTEYAEHFDYNTTGYISRPSADNILPSEEIFSDSLSTDFSDATSSDWSLFTSSDESSFTTESTRNSFSTVDCGDNAISSIFGGPFYAPEYSESSTISCTKFSPPGAETRFFEESTGYVMDPSIPIQPFGSVHKGRNIGRTHASSAHPLMSGGNCSLYDRHKSNLKDGFVQVSSEFCNM